MPAQAKPKSFEARQNSLLFFYSWVDEPDDCALAPCNQTTVPWHHVTKHFDLRNNFSYQMHEDKECRFSEWCNQLQYPGGMVLECEHA